MKKHRFRVSIKSLFGSHIDPEKDEELKGTKIGIYTSLKKNFIILLIFI